MLPWLRRRRSSRRRRRVARRSGRPAVLHLFAYTGLATLALAAAGAARRPRRRLAPDGRAGRGATPTGPGLPIARSAGSSTTRSAFTEREVRRGRRYAGDRPRPAELRARTGVRRLADRGRPAGAPRRRAGGLLEPDGFVLLTAHTAGFDGGPPRGASSAGRSADRPRRDRDRRPRRSTTDDGRDLGPRGLRTVAGRGMMTAMTSPTPPLLTSSRQPARQGGARALRDRRERDRTGLTLIDGAREVRRALDAGVEVVEAFVCEPLLAGPDARAALDRLRARDVRRSSRPTRRVFAKLAFGERAEGIARRRPDPVDSSSTTLALPADPLVVVIEGVEKPGNVGAVLRSADGAGADAVDRRLAADRPRSTRTRSAPAPGRSSRVPIAGRPDGRGPGLAPRARDRIVAARVDAERAYTDADLTGPLAIVLGAEADGLTDAWAARRHRGGPTCRCSASPTASTSRSARPSCSTRRAGSAASERPTEGVTMDTFDFVIIGAGPAGEAAALQGARARARRSRSSIGAGSAAAARTSAACRRSRCSTAPPGTTPTRPPTTGRAPRPHRDYMVNRPADADEPDDSSHVRAPRRRPARSSIAVTAAITGRGRVAVQPRRARPRAGRHEHRRRRRLGLEAAADRRAR